MRYFYRNCENLSHPEGILTIMKEFQELSRILTLDKEV